MDRTVEDGEGHAYGGDGPVGRTGPGGAVERGAVVLGAGMAGLFAAAVLSRHFARVTVVERDLLPDEAVPRRGVPQGRHVHALLGTGGNAFDRLFPGLGAELLAAGAVSAGLLSEMRYVLEGAPLARGDTGVSALQATRPMLETAVRGRVRALPGVRFLEGYDVLGIVGDPRPAPGDGRGRVTGVRVQRRTGDGDGAGTRADGGRGAGRTDGADVLPGALVVDALGKAGRSAGWLAGLGHPAPPEERTRIDVGYATRFLRLPPDALGGDKNITVASVPGQRARGAALLLQEGDRWLLTLVGMGGDHPAADDEGYLAFAREFLPAGLYDVLRNAEPLSEPVLHRFPHSVRRRYERLPTHPDGLVALGDSVCSFNPVYGQGMTVAALQAEALDLCLAAGREALPGRYYAAAARAVGPAWELAGNADRAVPGVAARRPPLAARLLAAYARRLVRVAHHDPHVAARYLRVLQLLDPMSTLLAPRTLAAVLRGPRRPRGARGVSG